MPENFASEVSHLNKECTVHSKGLGLWQDLLVLRVFVVFIPCTGA